MLRIPRWSRTVSAVVFFVLTTQLVQGAAATPAARQDDKGKAPAAPGRPTSSVPVNLKALRMGIEYLTTTFQGQYKNGAQHLATLAALEKSGRSTPDFAARCEELKFAALVLDNPLIDFDKLLMIKRDANNLGLPQNWQGNSSMGGANKMRNEIVALKIKDPGGAIETVFKPAQENFVGDVDLHFDGEKMLFSSLGANGRWQVFEVKTNGTGLRQVSPAQPADVDNYDPMYLPDGRIIFNCTGTFVGVPCVGGADYVANLHIMNPDGTNIRRLCFDQDNDWNPTLMPDGKVLFLRWEYTDSAHYFSRVLMRMNPDGTGQMEFYGSNSYWPNSLFYAKPIPGSTTQFVGIVSGHHGVPRMGELHLFDTSKGRQEDSGVVQQIPGYGKKFKGSIRDTLVDGSWPKFLHPFPLNDKYILVSSKPTEGSNWGVYLVDTFDNMVLLKEEPGSAMFEPVPLRKSVKPPVIPDRVSLADRSATVFLQNIYAGPGLRGVPKGTAKALRIFQYEYSYRNTGGHYVIGMEGPWDVRRIIGTVPLLEDGSAVFKIPANSPVSIQPLDAEGKALQMVRSWFVGMPGEYLSCTGCHEQQNQSAPVGRTVASTSSPVVPKPWYGPKRGFSFVREVQPVLNRYCAGCHDGKKAQPNLADSTKIRTSNGINSFPLSYTELHPFVRRNGPEGDYHVLTPLEFHADTSELVQMLTKGHYNVKLDAEAWDRLITWIDLNVPCYGTWREAQGVPGNFAKRRQDMSKQYALVDEDIEAVPAVAVSSGAFIQPPAMAQRPAALTVPGWPMPPEKAQAAQKSAAASDARLDLGNGSSIVLKRIPAGEFAMGDVTGEMDEFPMAKVKIDRAFWMGATEVSLQQFRAMEGQSERINGYYDQHYKDQVRPGYLMDNPEFPIIRVSWDEALAFCQWLSKKTGKKVTLPTEAQWEWACRAGTATPFWYGDLNTDFSKNANVADKQISKLAVEGVDPQPKSNPDKFWDFVPKDARFDDGVLHLAPVTKYQANPWGLQNMHGNVAEWTLSTYRPYPYDPAAGKDDATTPGKKVVRGGSWAERPKSARSSFRLPYPSWQRVYNVGFRVIVED